VPPAAIVNHVTSHAAPLSYHAGLARKLAGEPNLEFAEAPALAPPEVMVDQAQMMAAEAELAQARNAPLPDDDDEDL